MKKIITVILLFIIFIPKVNASPSSYIVMDMDNQRIIEGNNIHQRRLIASITKIMTCIIALENNNIEDIVTVDESVVTSYGSGIYINLGEKISLKDLLYGLMLRSGNDAALMIASYTAGSEKDFVKLMNQKAQELKMNNTTFINASGLDTSTTGNYSTSYDMALLTSYAMKNETYRMIVSTKKYTAKSDLKTFIWQNKNKLINQKYITGGKTGFTERARRTLVTTSNINNMNTVVVTLNDPDDWSTHKSLHEKIKNNYQSYKILNKNNYHILNDLYQDRLYIKDNIYLTLNESETKNLYNKIILKNYPQNNLIGTNNIYLNNRLVLTIPIYLKENKTKKSFWDKYKFW